jgi:gliding motility-associated-like protein
MEVCGHTVTLNAALAGESGYWSGTGLIADSTLPNTGVTIEEFSGSIGYTYEWKEWTWECRDSNTIDVTFYQAPEVPVLVPTIPLDYSFETDLDAPMTVYQGWWSMISGPEGGEVTFEDSTSNVTVASFTNYIYGDYILQWNVLNGACPVASAQTLVSIGNVELYNGFSPNGDGINEEYIINLSGTTTARLKIFDRWGHLVETVEDIDMRQIIWDGTAKGHPLPSGTYFYILEQDGIEYRAQGFIELRR